MDIQLTNIDLLIPDDGNPRVVSEDVLQYLKDSFSELGWLLPVYVLPDYTILSGHQRVTAWKALGGKQVPCVIIEDINMPLESMNLLFNVSTNDMMRSDDSSLFIKKFTPSNKKKKAVETFPVLNVEYVDVSEIQKSPELGHHNAYQHLLLNDIHIPIIISRDGRIANGKYRLNAYVMEGYKSIPVLKTNLEFDTISKYLNLLSMTFVLSDKYREFLDSNSFNRHGHKRKTKSLGHGYVNFINKTRFDKTSLSDVINLKKVIGQVVIDYGAGRMVEHDVLNSIGFTCFAFEPYIPLPGLDKLDYDRSMETGRVFFQKCLQYFGRIDSFVLNQVFNSVVSREQRKAIIIFSTLLQPKKLIIKCNHIGIVKHRTGKFLNMKYVFVPYEENIIIADMQHRPKVQKYHSELELYNLIKPYYRTIKIKAKSNMNYVIASDPIPQDIKELMYACEICFKLKYPDGRYFDLVKEGQELVNQLHGK